MAKHIPVRAKATTLKGNPAKPPGNPPNKIVAATGVAARSGVRGLGKVMEDAQQAAILQAAEDGISDPDEVRELMRVAREDAKKAFEKKAAEDAAAAEKERAAREAAAEAAKPSKR